MIEDKMLHLASQIVEAGLHKTNKVARQFVAEVHDHLKEGMQKKASFALYEKNLDQSKGFFLYVGWAYLVASGQTDITPSSGLLPSNESKVRKELEQDPNALAILDSAWGTGGGNPFRRRQPSPAQETGAKQAWTRFFKASATAFANRSEDHASNMFSILFLRPHAENTQSARSAWSIVGNSGANDLAGAINSLGAYVTRFMSRPQTVTQTDREVATDQIGTTLEQTVETTLSHWRPLAPDKYAEIATLLQNNDITALRAILAMMVDEDWSQAVASFWDDTILEEITDVATEVNSTMLAPLVIKNFKFLNLDQLSKFSQFIDECMGKDKLGAYYLKQMKNLNRSLAHWVNLYLAVSGGFSHGGVQIKGTLHGGGRAWAKAIMDVVEGGNSSAFFSALWSACSSYLPVGVMNITRADFVTVLEGFAFKYTTLKSQDPATAKKKFQDYFKAGYFKGGSDKYPQTLIGTPMAEATRMRLILAVIPDEFESQVEETLMVDCKQLIESFLEVPESVLEVIRDETSDEIVDEIIRELEEETREAIALNEQMGGGA